MGNANKIMVSICYVTPSIQEIIHFAVPADCTIEHAVEISGIKQKLKEVDFNKHTMGIYGKVVEKTYMLNDNDRIEIYRPLCMDPMQARRQRANIEHQ